MKRNILVYTSSCNIEKAIAISNDIKSYCKIGKLFFCFDADSENGKDFSSYEWDKEVDLIVLIVDSAILERLVNNHAILSYAKNNHLSILPIMIEEGIKGQFSELFGPYHCLDYGMDEKAQKMYVFQLERAFGCENTSVTKHEKSKYVFISYRKSDRAFAEQLYADLNEKLNDLQVEAWYDVFLRPGEDFHEQLDYILDNSMVFVLVVTPNLIKEWNYILRMEYPQAVQKGIKIMPVIMERTNTQYIYERFQELTEIYEYNDEFFSEIKKVITNLKEISN